MTNNKSKNEEITYLKQIFRAFKNEDRLNINRDYPKKSCTATSQTSLKTKCNLPFLRNKS